MITNNISISNALHQILKYDTTLTTLFNQVHLNEKLAVQIRELLPNEFAPHLANILIQEDRLVLWTTSPAWSSRLRFLLPKISQKFPYIKHIRVAVLPPTNDELNITSQLPPITRTLSLENSSQLLELATQVATPSLQAVLRKLAAHSKNFHT